MERAVHMICFPEGWGDPAMKRKRVMNLQTLV
jgi:hypothetical protein